MYEYGYVYMCVFMYVYEYVCVYVPVCLQVALANNETESQIEDKLAGLCDSLSFLGTSQAVVDCNKLSQLPDVSFTIAGKEFGLTPEQYILKVRPQAFLLV